MKLNTHLVTILFLILATTLEVSGDALLRKSMFQYTGTYRIVCIVISAALLTGYGAALNMAPVDFGKVVGLYIATLFIIWQIINYLVFHTFPPLSVLVGGSLIVAGGLIVTFAKF
jgi:small multidrug resistance family-3 protein